MPPGGATDIVARLIGQWLSERLGQPFVIENRPGAGGNIATEAVVRAPADGYTLLLVTHEQRDQRDALRQAQFQFHPRHRAGREPSSAQPNVMVVNPSVPAKTVPEFIAYAKANPGKINMASPGNGTSPHVAGELFKMMAGVDMVHVPYRGGAPALTDLLGGQVQVMFSVTMSASIEHIRAGKLRALAVTTATRSEALPDIPTVGDFVPGYEASSWFGIGAPKNTPAEIVDKLNKEINAGLADPKIKARLADLGGDGASGLARRLRQAHRRRNREVGQGDPGRQHQGGMKRRFTDISERDVMKLPRRQFLHLAAGAAALPAVSRIAWAQAYPTRPVRIVVGFAAGGATDILARLIGQWLSERLGQPFVIENRPGAGSNIGTEAVVRAPPDGYTLLLVGAAQRDQRDALRQAQFQFHPRHRAGRGHHRDAQRHGGESIGSGQDRSRVHRLCQGQSRQDQHGVGRQRNARPICPASCSR